jgi:hypothetical protein
MGIALIHFAKGKEGDLLLAGIGSVPEIRPCSDEMKSCGVGFTLRLSH